MGEARAQRLLLRGQGEPLPDPRATAAGPGRAAGAALESRPTAGRPIRPGALPAAAALAPQPRAAGDLPRRAARAPAGGRVPRPRLVRADDLRAAARGSRGALPARHGRLGDAAGTGRADGLPALPRRRAAVRRTLSFPAPGGVGGSHRRVGGGRPAGVGLLQQRHRRPRRPRRRSAARPRRAAHRRQRTGRQRASARSDAAHHLHLAPP